MIRERHVLLGRCSAVVRNTSPVFEYAPSSATMPSLTAALNRKLVASNARVATLKRYSCTGVAGASHLQSPPVLSCRSAHVVAGWVTRQDRVAVPRSMQFSPIGKLLHDAATTWPWAFLHVRLGDGSRA